MLSSGFQGLEGLRRESSAVRGGLEQPDKPGRLACAVQVAHLVSRATGAPSAACPAAEPQSSGLCPKPGDEGWQRDAALEGCGVSVAVIISPNSLPDNYVPASCGSRAPWGTSGRWGRRGRPRREEVARVPPGRPGCSIGSATWPCCCRNPGCGPLRRVCSCTTWTSSEATRAS